MMFSARQSQDPRKMMADEYLHGERAVSRAMRAAAVQIKAEWRAEITRAGLGGRMANTVRSAAYPTTGESMNAAAMIWTKAPVIVASHEQGVLIRSSSEFWLAIPLPSAGKGRGGRRMTPGEYEQRTGQSLRFVFRKGRTALLVADEARLTVRGQARRKGGRRRKDGILTGAQTIPVFVLVPQVKLRKRTNLVASADMIAGQVEADIAFGIGN